jgi:hypothetical protein
MADSEMIAATLAAGLLSNPNSPIILSPDENGANVALSLFATLLPKVEQLVAGRTVAARHRGGPR